MLTTTENHSSASPRWPFWLLALGIALHFAVSWFYSYQHFFIPDEIVYFLMNQALAEGHLWLKTGYDEFASPMFVFSMSSLHEGRVYPQYPATYAALSLPFYLALGKAGLFTINHLCFLLILALVYRIQKLLFQSDQSAWFALLLCVFGGYLWVYSQAIVPHLLQVTLLLGSAWLLLRAFMAQTKCTTRDYLLSGLLLGLALGVRYDSLFALPMLVLPLLFARPVRWRALGLILPGIVFGLAVLSYTNHIKFGTYMPFTYNAYSEAGHANFKPLYLYLAVLGTVGLAVIWVGTRLHAAQRLPATQWLVLAGLAFLMLLFSLFTKEVVSFLYGFLFTVVDFSILPMEANISVSASRTPHGGVLFLGEYRRSLLQSAPFIALITLLALQPKLKTPPREWIALVWLALVPVVFLFFFSLLRWEGGFAWHMRYYTPTLPFFAMIAAQAFSRFLTSLNMPKPDQWLAPFMTGVVMAVIFALYADGTGFPEREWWFLKLPLWMWAIVPLSAVLAFYDGAGVFLRQLAVLIMGFAIFWGGTSTMLAIYPHINNYKNYLNDMSASYEDVITKDAVVVSIPRYFVGLFEDPERTLRVATIFNDGEIVTKEDMRAMITHFLNLETAVYITHDMKSMPIIERQLPDWGMRMEQVRDADEQTDTPAISRFYWDNKDTP